MTRSVLPAAVALLIALPALGQTPRKFVASSVEGAGIAHEGKIVISNDGRTITAWQFHRDIRTSLVRLRSAGSLRYRPYGSVIYDSSGRLGPRVPASLVPIIEQASAEYGVDPRLVAAIARQESGFQADVVSSKGAQGVMQLMPATAAFLGVRNAFDVRQNIFGGTRYLKMLLDTFRGDLDLALAAYNAGPGAVERYAGIPPYRETIAYVKSVRKAYEAAIRL